MDIVDVHLMRFRVQGAVQSSLHKHEICHTFEHKHGVNVDNFNPRNLYSSPVTHVAATSTPRRRDVARTRGVVLRK